MPTDTIRASGNNQYGVMSDAERANFGSAQSAQDFILRKRMQDEALAHSDALQQRGETAAERINSANLAAQREDFGTFAEKQAADDARANRTMSPQMEMLRQQEERYKDQQTQEAPTRELEAARLKMRLGLYPQGGASGFTMTPDLQKRAFEHELGLGEAPDVAFQRGLSEKIIGALAGRAAEGGDIGALQGIMGAAKSGDLSKIPTNLGPEPQALSSADVKNMLSAKVADFSKNATKMFGYNPTSDDVTSIVQGRDQLAQSIKAENPRLDIMKARDAANQIIDTQLLQSGAISTSAGGKARTRELRQRLGLIPGG